MRLMSLHGLSQDAWERYSGDGSWDYRIVAPGYKYNLTDIAAAIGIHQLARAEEMRRAREAIAEEYLRAARRRRGDRTAADRCRPASTPGTCFRSGCVSDAGHRSRQLHQRAGPRGMHVLGALAAAAPPSVLRGDVRNYAARCPIASRTYGRQISLPIYSNMTEDEVERDVSAVKNPCGGGPMIKRAFDCTPRST